MVDASMSTFKDLRFEAEAAAHFIRQVVRPGDTLGVCSFSGNRFRASQITFPTTFSDCRRPSGTFLRARAPRFTTPWCSARTR